MKRLAACALLCLLTGSASASGVYIGKSLSTYYSRVAAPSCGQPASDPVWTDSSHIRQTFARCELRGSFRILTPTAVITPTLSPTPRPTFTPLPTSTPWPTPTATQPVSSDPAQQLLALVNQHRAAYGSAPLSLITDATTQAHANAMRDDGTIWHTSPNHPAESFPYDSFWAENVGAGQSVQQIDQLMIGEGTSTCRQGIISHACNIVNPNFRSVAIGIAYGPPYGLFLTEDFK